MGTLDFVNEHVRLELLPNGLLGGFIDRRSGKNYRDPDKPAHFAGVKVGGDERLVSGVQRIEGGVRLSFDGTGVQVDLKVVEKRRYFVLEVVNLLGGEVDELLFANACLTLAATPDDELAACALALNLKTNVPEMPGLNRRLRAIGYRQFGVVGAKVALLGCPAGELRELLKEVVGEAEELPRSPVGGPWALDTAMSKGSFVFDYGDINEHNVEQWIGLVKDLGFSQIEFHGAEAKSFRFGDCVPNPQLHPQGWDSVKKVIDKLHGAGIAAVLHTYSFCIDKKCAWVTPVPDPRLAKDAVFTLASSIDTGADIVPAVESTEGMSAVVGAHLPELDILQNGVTLQIDDELMVYSGVAKQAPYGFSGCSRGAHGTRMSHHGRGAKIYHLKECFGYFIPDEDSSLFPEVAARSAEFCDYCGFDSIYLDALDGESSFKGRRFGWHYGAKFAFELHRRLKKAALMEMATFHHHLWCLRSRVGAWDHPLKGYKRFIDHHVASNAQDQRMFMPGHLGWWSLGPRLTWSAAAGWETKWNLAMDVETEFTDDIEYLCGKALATDACVALMAILPDSGDKNATVKKKIEIIHKYERLRQSGALPESTKALLRRPGVEATLEQDAEGGHHLKPMEYIKRKLTLNKGGGKASVTNRFGRQQLRMRLESLLSVGPHDSPDSLTLSDFSDMRMFTDRANAPGVEATLTLVERGQKCAAYTATNNGGDRTAAWAKIGRKFHPPANLAGHEGLGVWIHGDGQGEVLNFQLLCPGHVSSTCSDRCVPIDFTGWRYFELIESETDHYVNYHWPYVYRNSLMEMPSDPMEMEVLTNSGRHLYRAPYHIFGGNQDFSRIESFGLWYNNLPRGGTVECLIGAVKALPLRRTTLRNPRVGVGAKEMLFPVDIETGQYLEFHSMSDCVLYNLAGEAIREVRPEGEAPELCPGENSIHLVGDNGDEGISTRVQLTVITGGDGDLV